MHCLLRPARVWALLMASAGPGDSSRPQHEPWPASMGACTQLRTLGCSCVAATPAPSSVLSTQVLFRSLPVLPPVEHVCHTATHNTGQRSKTVTPGPKARQRGFVVTLRRGDCACRSTSQSQPLTPAGCATSGRPLTARYLKMGTICETH